MQLLEVDETVDLSESKILFEGDFTFTYTPLLDRPDSRSSSSLEILTKNKTHQASRLPMRDEYPRPRPPGSSKGHEKSIEMMALVSNKQTRLLALENLFTIFQGMYHGRIVV